MSASKLTLGITMVPASAAAGRVTYHLLLSPLRWESSGDGPMELNRIGERLRADLPKHLQFKLNHAAWEPDVEVTPVADYAGKWWEALTKGTTTTTALEQRPTHYYQPKALHAVLESVRQHGDIAFDAGALVQGVSGNAPQTTVESASVFRLGVATAQGDDTKIAQANGPQPNSMEQWASFLTRCGLASRYPALLDRLGLRRHVSIPLAQLKGQLAAEEYLLKATLAESFCYEVGLDVQPLTVACALKRVAGDRFDHRLRNTGGIENGFARLTNFNVTQVSPATALLSVIAPDPLQPTQTFPATAKASGGLYVWASNRDDASQIPSILQPLPPAGLPSALLGSGELAAGWVADVREVGTNQWHPLCLAPISIKIADDDTLGLVVDGEHEMPQGRGYHRAAGLAAAGQVLWTWSQGNVRGDMRNLDLHYVINTAAGTFLYSLPTQEWPHRPFDARKGETPMALLRPGNWLTGVVADDASPLFSVGLVGVWRSGIFAAIRLLEDGNLRTSPVNVTNVPSKVGSLDAPGIWSLAGRWSVSGITTVAQPPRVLYRGYSDGIIRGSVPEWRQETFQFRLIGDGHECVWSRHGLTDIASLPVNSEDSVTLAYDGTVIDNVPQVRALSIPNDRVRGELRRDASGWSFIVGGSTTPLRVTWATNGFVPESVWQPDRRLLRPEAVAVHYLGTSGTVPAEITAELAWMSDAPTGLRLLVTSIDVYPADEEIQFVAAERDATGTVNYRAMIGARSESFPFNPTVDWGASAAAGEWSEQGEWPLRQRLRLGRTAPGVAQVARLRPIIPLINGRIERVDIGAAPPGQPADSSPTEIRIAGERYRLGSLSVALFQRDWTVLAATSTAGAESSALRQLERAWVRATLWWRGECDQHTIVFYARDGFGIELAVAGRFSVAEALSDWAYYEVTFVVSREHEPVIVSCVPQQGQMLFGEIRRGPTGAYLKPAVDDVAFRQNETASELGIADPGGAVPDGTWMGVSKPVFAFAITDAAQVTTLIDEHAWYQPSKKPILVRRTDPLWAWQFIGTAAMDSDMSKGSIAPQMPPAFVALLTDADRIRLLNDRTAGANPVYQVRRDLWDISKPLKPDAISAANTTLNVTAAVRRGVVTSGVLFNWEGWSIQRPMLVAKDASDAAFAVDSLPIKRALLPLRFGRRYEFRVRVVDVVGARPTVVDAEPGPDYIAVMADPYHRRAPVLPPRVYVQSKEAPTDPWRACARDSTLVMHGDAEVLRLLPPATGYQIVRDSGTLDPNARWWPPEGNPDPVEEARFKAIRDRDIARRRTLLTNRETPADAGTAPGVPPTARRWSTLVSDEDNGALALTYLPDPSAFHVVVSAVGLDGSTWKQETRARWHERTAHVDTGDSGEWPDANVVEIRVVTGGNPGLTGGGREIQLALPAGMRVELTIWCVPHDDHRAFFLAADLDRRAWPADTYIVCNPVPLPKRSEIRPPLVLQREDVTPAQQPDADLDISVTFKVAPRTTGRVDLEVCREIWNDDPAVPIPDVPVSYVINQFDDPITLDSVEADAHQTGTWAGAWKRIRSGETAADLADAGFPREAADYLARQREREQSPLFTTAFSYVGLSDNGIDGRESKRDSEICVRDKIRVPGSRAERHYCRSRAWSRYESYYREFPPKGGATPSTLSRDEGPELCNAVIRPSRVAPAAPGIGYVVPLVTLEQNPGPVHEQTIQFRRSGFRVYLQRPWFGTGPDEAIALVFGPQSTRSAVPQPAATTNWAMDPIWLDRAAPWTNLSYAAVLGKNPGAFEVARLPNIQCGVQGIARPVRFSVERGYWYADFFLPKAPVYGTFVQLALARVQPHAMASCGISEIVALHYCPMAPDRAVTLRKDPHDQDSYGVVVSGNFPPAAAGGRSLDVKVGVGFELWVAGYDEDDPLGHDACSYDPTTDRFYWPGDRSGPGKPEIRELQRAGNDRFEGSVKLDPGIRRKLNWQNTDYDRRTAHLTLHEHIVPLEENTTQVFFDPAPRGPTPLVPFTARLPARLFVTL